MQQCRHRGQWSHEANRSSRSCDGIGRFRYRRPRRWCFSSDTGSDGRADARRSTTREGSCRDPETRGTREVRGDGRRQRVAVGRETDQRARHDERDHERRDPERAVKELRGSAADGSRIERGAGLRPRHQRHEPRGHRHAGNRPAGAPRRPQPVSGLLRLRDVGLPAGKLRRGEADRGHPWTRIGRLGRERPVRRGQRHHEIASRDAGDDSSGRLWRVRSRGSAGCRIALVRERHPRAGHQRQMVVQDFGRRLLTGSDGTADRHRALRSTVCLPIRPTRNVSGVQERRRRSAEDRRPRRLRLSGWAQVVDLWRGQRY